MTGAGPNTTWRADAPKAPPRYTERETEALRRVERWLARKQERRLTRDDTGQLIAVTEPDGAEAFYAYDDRGDLSAIREADGSRTAYQYDDRQRLIQVTRADEPVPSRYTEAVQGAFLVQAETRAVTVVVCPDVEARVLTCGNRLTMR